MPRSPEGFEKNSKGFLREPLAPSTVRWTDHDGVSRSATSHIDSEFYVHWTLDTGEVVKWGRLAGVIIGEHGQKTIQLESEWTHA